MSSIQTRQLLWIGSRIFNICAENTEGATLIPSVKEEKASILFLKNSVFALKQNRLCVFGVTRYDLYAAL